jgi:NAD+ synthase
MIKDCEVVFNALVKWTRDRVLAAGATTGVVGLSGGADSALVAYILKAAFGEQALGVIMPCHSSAWAQDRAYEVSNKSGLRVVKVDLTPSYNSITAQFGEVSTNPGLLTTGALRSCLRAPALDYAAKLVNGLIIGTGNRDEDGLVRYFQKRGDGCVDISPIAGLHKSEVFQLLRYLQAPQSIIDAKPSADLWGPDTPQEDEQEMGLTYADVEWAANQDDAWGFITGDRQNEVLGVLLYTDAQKEILAKVRRMERATRHKVAPIPAYTNIRSNDWFEA